MIKILEKNDSKISFQADMPFSLANAIRRSVNEIPILAIDELEITNNDSALYDEIIAHRVGLIPLKNENLKLKEDCNCEGKGCGKCMVKFKLSFTGPGTVYSDDLSPKGNNVYKMPIALLDKEQELAFVGIGRMGKGIKHSKFSPGLLYYRYSDDNGLETDEEHAKKLFDGSEKDEKKQITMFIESWGSITPREIFLQANEALIKNLKELSKSIK